MRREFSAAAVVVLAVCFGFNTLARGFGETFAVFYPSILAEFGWSRAETSSIYSVFMISIAGCGPFIGWGVERFGARAAYATGLAAIAIAFFGASAMQSLWQAWLTLGVLLGFGAAATGMTTATTIIARWFDRRLALAISLAYAGLAAGAFLMAPLMGVMIQAIGWRETYGTLAWALIALACVALVVPWGRIEAGAGFGRPPARSGAIPWADFAQAPFWGLFFTFFFATMSTYAIQVQAVVYLEEVGYAPVTAAFLFGVISLMALVGIVVSGWLTDRFGHRRVASFMFGMTIVGVLALWRLGEGAHPFLLGVFILAFGGSMGSRGPVVSSLLAMLYPGRVGAVTGATLIGLGLGGALGSWGAGALYELTGDYRGGFALAICACILGASQFWLIADLKHPKRRA